MDEGTQKEVAEWEAVYSEHRENLVKNVGSLGAQATQAQSAPSGRTYHIKPDYVLKMFKWFIEEYLSIWEQIRTMRRRAISNEALTKQLTTEVDGLHDERLKTESQITTALENIDRFIKTYTPLLEELESERQERLKAIRQLER